MSATYGYDQDSRLTSATSGGTTTAYGYDNAGNLTQDGGTTSTYNPQDQLNTSTDSAGTTAYGYSLSGTLSSVTPPRRPGRGLHVGCLRSARVGTGRGGLCL